MKKLLFLFPFLAFIFFLITTQVRAAISYNGGEYINLHGTGTAATAHIGDNCNISSGTCSGAFVIKSVCDGRTTQCDGGHTLPQSVNEVRNGSLSLGIAPGTNKTVQIDVFDKECRGSDGNWICGGETVKDYIVWYSGTAQQSESVSTCKGNSGPQNRERLQYELKLAGYNGPWTLTEEIAAFNRAACPIATATPTPRPVQPTPTTTPQPTTPTQPTVTPRPTTIPQPTATPIPSQNQSGDLKCPDGTTATISGSNIICVMNQQQQAQTQTAYGGTAYANATGGSVNVTYAASNPQTVKEVRVIQAGTTVDAVETLPKTGLPIEAVALTGLFPTGLFLRKFGLIKGVQSQTPFFMSKVRELLVR